MPRRRRLAEHDNPYLVPTGRRRSRPAIARRPASGLGFAGAMLTDPAAPAAVTVEGIEVVQAIQDLAHSVPLIAGKNTLVRVYLKHSTAPASGEVRGELEVSTTGPDGAATYVPTADTVKLIPAAPVSLDDQRHDLSLSLNFILPADLTREGRIWLTLGRLRARDGSEVAHVKPPPLEIEFQAGPVLRIKVLGYRYRSHLDGRVYSPDAIHFDYLRSFLTRALPISSLRWQHIVLDADFASPFINQDSGLRSERWTAHLANAQTSALRIRDIEAGGDPGVRYLALVDDARKARGHFMQGLASGIPRTADVDVVAASPAGATFAWDTDMSYADWYGTHELCHTFGRKHIGVPRGVQPRDDGEYPYDDGILSGDSPRYVGLDFGDPTLKIRMKALPANRHRDVMSYGAHQWLSDYTYRAVLERLRAENAAFPPAPINEGSGT